MKRIILSLCLLIIISCQRNFSPVEVNPNNTMCLCYNKQDDHNNWQIYLTDISGHKKINISNNPNNDAYTPVWSPTGKYIAFRRDNDYDKAEIYLYDIDEQTNINITEDLAMNESASPVLWTPNGEKLVYWHHTMGEDAIYKIMNKDGTDKQFLLEQSIGYDSQNIVKFYQDGFHFIYTYKQDVYKTNITRSFTETILLKSNFGGRTVHAYDFDPYQERILLGESKARFSGSEDRLLIYDTRNHKIDTVATADKESKSFIHTPVFSNDCSKTVFTRTFDEYSTGAVCIWEDGVEQTILDEYNDYRSPQFSPGNNYIAYERRINTTTGEWVSFTTYLYIININTKENYLIDNGNDAKWNPLFAY